MESKRRVVGLSLGGAAAVVAVAWLTWDRWPGATSTTYRDPAQAEAPGSSDDSPIVAADSDTKGSATVDFSGKWQLDVDASDSLDAILTAIGLSYVERALVNNTVVTHVITQTPHELTIEVQTTFFGRTDHLPLNGQPADAVDPAGRPVESVTTWSDDGRQLTTKILVRPDNQHFTLTRSLDEGQDLMKVLVEFLSAKGQNLSSRRVYRRVN